MFEITGPAAFNGGVKKTVKYSEFTSGSYTLTNVPAGEYTVKETSNGATTTYPIKSTTVNNNNATSDTLSTITATGNKVTFEFVNEYEDNSTADQGTIVITKTIEGPVTDNDRDNLVFEVYKAGTTTNPVWTGTLGNTAYFDCDSSTGVYTSKPISVDTGDYYVVEKLTTPEGTVTVTYTISDGTNTSNGTVTADYANKKVTTESFSVAKDETQKLSFKNVYATGTLVIKKSIGGLTDTSVIDPASIEFTITGPAAFNNGVGSDTVTCAAFTNGEYRLTGVPAGEYMVEETSNGATTTYSIKSTTVNNNNATSDTLNTITEANNEVTFEFVNVYEKNNQQTSYGEFSLTKTIVLPAGVSATVLDPITFTVTPGLDGSSSSTLTLNSTQLESGWSETSTNVYTYKNTNVPTGDYTVVETGYGETSAYVLDTQNSDVADKTTSVSTTAGSVAFKNVYSDNQQSTNGSLVISKKIILPANTQYSDIGTIEFTIYEDDQTTVVATITLNPADPSADGWTLDPNSTDTFIYTY